MKRIIIIIFFMIVADFAKAQTTYDTCQYLNRYAGEWMYANGQDTIRIWLRPHRSFSPIFDWVSDRLWGWHEYKRGTSIVESNYQHRNIYLPYYRVKDSTDVSKYSILLSLRECDPVQGVLSGLIRDYSQAGELKEVSVAITGITMVWKQQHSEGYGVFSGAYGMTLPKEFVLVKQ